MTAERGPGAGVIGRLWRWPVGFRARARLTLDTWRRLASSVPGPPFPRWVVVGLLAALPLAKWAQFELAPDAVRVRQAVLILVLVAAVAVAYGLPRLLSAAVVWQLAKPAPSPGAGLAGGRTGRLVLAAICLLTAVLSALFALRGWSPLMVRISLIPPMASVAVFAVVERRRELAWRRGEGPRPDRALLWTVAPAVIWWCVVLLVGGLGDGYRTSLESTGALVAGSAGSALDTAVVVGFAEEYLFRGLLFALAIRSGFDRGGFAAVSVSFALWHLPDATSVGDAVVSLVITFLASQLVLFPLRLRSRGVAGPAVFHAANNVAFRLLV